MFVVFPPRDDYSYLPLLDLELEDDCIISKEFRNPFLRKINLIHTSLKSNSKVDLPLKSIWYNFYFKKNSIKGDNVVFLFFEGNRLSYDSKYHNYLYKRYPNAKFVFRFMNTARFIQPRYLNYVEQNYDLIISYDKKDCQKYGWIEHHSTYGSDSYKNIKPTENKVFFVGKDKGRLDELIQISKTVENCNYVCDINIAGVEKKRQISVRGISYIRKMPYSETLNRIKKSTCLLEIVQNGQAGCTLRTLEAVAYDKLLISNNMELLNEPFYDDRFMLVYTDISQIAVWLKEKKSLDVQYKTKREIANRTLIECIKNNLISDGEFDKEEEGKG